MKPGKAPMILFLILCAFVVYVLFSVARKPERTHAPQMKSKKAALGSEEAPLATAAAEPNAILSGELKPGEVVEIPVRSHRNNDDPLAPPKTRTAFK